MLLALLMVGNVLHVGDCAYQVIGLCMSYAMSGIAMAYADVQY